LPDSFAVQEVGGGWGLPRVALALMIWLVIGSAACVLTFRWQRSDER